MFLDEMKTAEAERRRSRAYHAACEAQYVAAAAKLRSEKMKAKALANAEYHRKQVEALDKRGRA